MKKIIFAFAAVATIALGSLSASTPAEARCYNCGIGLGILGGVAAGAIIGSAIASHPGYYGYEYEPQLQSRATATGRAGGCTTVTAISSAGAAHAGSAVNGCVTGADA